MLSKHATQDSINNIKLPSTKFSDLQSLIESQSLVFHKCVCLSVHLLVEGRLKLDGMGFKIRKFREDDKKDRRRRSATRNVAMQF